MAVSAKPAPGSYRLDQIGFCQCKFPTATVGGEHRFCGQPTTIGGANRHGSWCDEHLAIVFESWRPGGQVLRRAGRT